MEYLLLILGFVLLIKGADFFVDGCSSVAKLLKIPPVIIGLTIVSIGTSMPEAAVSLTAALSGNNALAIANVVGSNIFNLLSVVGASALICPFIVDKTIMKRDFPICIGIIVAFTLMLIDKHISRIEGTILFIAFVLYIVMLVRSAIKNREEAEEEFKTLSPLRSALYIVGGAAAIILGGNFTVDSASVIAANLGMSQTLIGLTIVAVGTSLPELVTSVVAAKKGESALALGNVVGSNIFNILFVLGASAMVSPLSNGMEEIIDAVICIVVCGIMYLV